jgi:hypothetical protein
MNKKSLKQLLRQGKVEATWNHKDGERQVTKYFTLKEDFVPEKEHRNLKFPPELTPQHVGAWLYEKNEWGAIPINRLVSATLVTEDG